MDHIFMYVKSSSLNLRDAQITEISGVRTNGQVGPANKRSVVAAFTTKIDSNLSFKNAVTNIKRNLLVQGDKYVVITYLTDIVRTLIRNECEKHQEDELFAGRAWIDISQLAWPLVSNGMLEGRKIEVLAKHFKVSLGSHDDSADICTAIVSIYGHMMRRYKTALAGEEAIRDIGGETLENIRNMIGF